MAILNSLNAKNFPIFQLILMILVSKFMVHRALCDNTHLSSGLLSPLSYSKFSTDMYSDVDHHDFPVVFNLTELTVA